MAARVPQGISGALLAPSALAAAPLSSRVMAPGTPSRAPAARRRVARWATVFAAVAVGAVAALAYPPANAHAGLAMPVDARDARGPLDLTEVSLVQRDVRMALRIATAGRWTAKDITGALGRELCVTLVHGTPAIARGRVCVTRHERRPALSYTPLRADGTPGTRRRLAAAVGRPRQSVLQATFLPAAAGLSIGRYGWFATSVWNQADTCPRLCRDRLPDGGMVAANVALLGAAPCFGAAARDPERPCENAALRMIVEPSPARSHDLQEPFCDRRESNGLLAICSFGAAAEEAADSFALIGDSHAGGLKAALEVLTLAKRWRGSSILRSGCPPTQSSSPTLPTAERSQGCVRFNDQVLAWLDAHPEVNTVFLSAHATATVATSAGQTMAAALQTGYREQLRALLRRVPRVVVIRDVPHSRSRQVACISIALAAGSPPGTACALPRADVMTADQLAAAALEMRAARVRVIDLTSHFCDESRCFPVVGGALVQRDETHLTTTFSATLGPYVLRALLR